MKIQSQSTEATRSSNRSTTTATTTSCSSRSSSNRRRGKETESCHGQSVSAIRKLWTTRILFLSTLCAVAVILGYGAYRIIKDSERKLAEEHFDGIAGRTLDEILKTTLRLRRGAKSLAAVASFAFPDAQIWPNVSMYGFEGIAASVMETADTNTMGLCPLVLPEQREAFEEFAYNAAFQQINWHYPNNTALRDFDGDGTLEQGIFGFDSNLQMYQEKDGKTDWNTSYEILTPIMMHSAGPPILMFNIHSMQRFGEVVDELLDCAWGGTGTDDQANQVNQSVVEDEDVAQISDISYLGRCSILSDLMIMYDEGKLVSQSVSHLSQFTSRQRCIPGCSSIINYGLSYIMCLVSVML